MYYYYISDINILPGTASIATRATNGWGKETIFPKVCKENKYILIDCKEKKIKSLNTVTF